MTANAPSPERLLKTAGVIAIGFTLSPVLFALVGWLVAGAHRPASNGSNSVPLILGLGLISLTAFFLAFRVHRFMPGSWPKGGEADNREKLLRQGFPRFIIRLALFEFVSILGLVLSLILNAFYLMVPFVFLSLIGMVLSRPTEDLLGQLGGKTK